VGQLPVAAVKSSVYGAVLGDELRREDRRRVELACRPAEGVLPEEVTIRWLKRGSSKISSIAAS
jgi:surface antigen